MIDQTAGLTKSHMATEVCGQRAHADATRTVFDNYPDIS